LATWADFLICAAPGGAATRHLVNADVLTALGPQGYLVNIGRGTVVDTAALIDALQGKRIAGAGLDVLEGEPALPPLLPQLLQFDNVVITPHCAGRAPEARTAATALILANLNAYFSGKPLLSPVVLKQAEGGQGQG
jgi:lactate dehydrogenase-like 2-hydroxyacid dehydrogenase